MTFQGQGTCYAFVDLNTLRRWLRFERRCIAIHAAYMAQHAYLSDRWQHHCHYYCSAVAEERTLTACIEIEKKRLKGLA